LDYGSSRRASSGPILCGIAFKKGGLYPYDNAPVLANPLVRRVDPEAPGADPELEDRARRPGVFHFGSRILTDPATIAALEQDLDQHARPGGELVPAGGLGRAPGRAVRAVTGRRGAGRAVGLGDLDSDGLPIFQEGEQSDDGASEDAVPTFRDQHAAEGPAIGGRFG
jgi:hypothetical protein